MCETPVVLNPSDPLPLFVVRDANHVLELLQLTHQGDVTILKYPPHHDIDNKH